ncbi:MAG: BMP family ABC transporter substrate-binding protein [Spirochaetales bacterium]|nr:BMP family ABC transporter substrate-binding protein [Spirochaetales bacterium]
MKNNIKTIILIVLIFIFIIIIIHQQILLKKLHNKVKVAFVYIGDIGDFGWTYAHEAGRIQLRNNFKNLEIIYRESVSPENFTNIVKDLIEKEKCKIIVSTSYSFDSYVIKLADLYPDIYFLSCAGMTAKKNLIPYFIDVYQIYYLNGLISGGLSKNGKVGYIGGYKIPELIRHINAFTIGLKEVNPDAQVFIYWLNSWYSPIKTSNIAQKMIEQNIDIIAYTEDSSSIPTTCQKYYEKTGRKVYTFSHYSPMDKFGSDVIVSGQLVNWGLIYTNLFSKILSGKIEPKLHYWFANSNAAIFGKNYSCMISDEAKEILKNKKIKINSKVTNLYDYIIQRYDQIKDPLISFDPFTGPLYSNKNELKILNKERAGLKDLLTMDWFVPSIFEIDY